MISNFPYSDDFLASMRLLGDPVADSFINKCFSEPELKTKFYTWLKSLSTNSELHHIPEDFASDLLFNGINNLPAFADIKLLEAGIEFFGRYEIQIMQLLGLLSLPYCYAAADGAMVLYHSERLRNDTIKRLEDTGQFVLDVQSKAAFTEQGKAFAAILKTRLTHAIARYYTLNSGHWNDEWGIPVNQEDMAGTNLAFSLIIIRGLRKTGNTISYDEQHAFLHLWAVISSLLGLDERLIPMNGKAANNLELSIRKRQFKASVHGQELTQSLIDSFTKTDATAQVSSKEIKQLMAYLLGKEIAGLIGITDVGVPIHIPYLLKVFSAFQAWNPRLSPKKSIR